MTFNQPVAIETTGVYGKSTVPCLSGLAKKLVDVSVDPKERQWLHQVCPWLSQWLWSMETLPAYIGLCASLI